MKLIFLALFIMLTICTYTANSAKMRADEEMGSGSGGGGDTPALIQTQKEIVNTTQPVAKNDQQQTVGHTMNEIAFSIAVLIFGLLLVCVECFIVLKGALSQDMSFKLIGLTIVITAALFLIPAGYSQNQIGPLVTLLGTVAGYLFGRDIRPSPKKGP